MQNKVPNLETTIITKSPHFGFGDTHCLCSMLMNEWNLNCADNDRLSAGCIGLETSWDVITIHTITTQKYVLFA